MRDRKGRTCEDRGRHGVMERQGCTVSTGRPGSSGMGLPGPPEDPPHYTLIPDGWAPEFESIHAYCYNPSLQGSPIKVSINRPQLLVRKTTGCRLPRKGFKASGGLGMVHAGTRSPSAGPFSLPSLCPAAPAPFHLLVPAVSPYRVSSSQSFSTLRAQLFSLPSRISSHPTFAQKPLFPRF